MDKRSTDPEGHVVAEVRSEGSRKLEAIRGHWLTKAIAMLLTALVPAIVTWTSTNETSRERTAEVKDKAESGYQFTKDALDEQREFNRGIVAQLERMEARIAGLERKQRLTKRREAPRAPPPPTPPPPTPPPAPFTQLPPDLDKALQAQQLMQQAQQQQPQQQQAPKPATPP